jgi:hypothetical protein
MPLSDELVCAAVDRALRHLLASEVCAADIADHLGLPTDRSALSGVVSVLDSMTNRGLLDQVDAGRLALWRLLEAGRDLVAAGAKRLARIESPDHRDWRVARERATANLDQVRLALSREMAQLARLLSTPEVPATTWLAVSKRITQLTHGMAVATHVLHERPEPFDATTAQALVQVDGPNDWMSFTYRLGNDDESSAVIRAVR